LAQALGLPEAELKPGRLSYELRRLRLHGIIERIAKSHRYRLTRKACARPSSTAECTSACCAPGAVLQGGPPVAEPPHLLKAKLAQLEALIDAYTEEQLAA
jgi:hypothetical protein